MWFDYNVQHPHGLMPPTNLDRIVDCTGLLSGIVTLGDVLVLDTTTASNLSFDANSRNSIFGRVMQATANEVPSGIACVALESVTIAEKPLIRVRFAGIVTCKVHWTIVGNGGSQPLRGRGLVISQGGGTPGRSLTLINAPAVASARKGMLLQTGTITEGQSELLPVLFNGFPL